MALSMGLTTQVGLAVSSNNTNNLASATFANVSVGTFQTDLFLKQNGRDMRNGHGNGDVVPLHGVNVGTWLMYEPSFGAMDNFGTAGRVHGLQHTDHPFRRRRPQPH